MTRATRDLSLTTNTPQGHRNVSQYGGGADNFDSSSPSRLSFYVDDEAIILEAALRIEISAYRTWETDTAAGGSSTPTTAAGGSSTPTSSAAASHRHRMFDQGGGTALGLANKSITAWNSDTGTAIVLDMATNASHLDTKSAAGSHDHTVSVAAHQHSVTIPSHVHQQTYQVVEIAGVPGPISISLDSINIDSLIGGPWIFTALPGTIDASLTGSLVAPGWHTLEISTSSGLARASAYVVIKSLQLQ